MVAKRKIVRKRKGEWGSGLKKQGYKYAGFAESKTQADYFTKKWRKEGKAARNTSARGIWHLWIKEK